MAFNKEDNQFVISNYKKEMRKLRKQIKKNNHTVSILSQCDDISEEDVKSIAARNIPLNERLEQVNDLINSLTKLERRLGL